MLIRPGIEAASNDLFGVIFEIVKDRDVWIACDLCSLLANLLKGPQIIGILFVIRSDAEAA